MSRPVAYGQAFGGRAIVDVWTTASQTFQANSGKWVGVENTSRTATLVSGTYTNNILGWADVGTFTSSSTDGADIIPVNTDMEAVYEMPINATQSEHQLKLLKGKVCDIVLTSNIQYAAYNAATDKTLLIVGYKYYGSGTGEQSLLVKRYSLNISNTLVA